MTPIWKQTGNVSEEFQLTSSHDNITQLEGFTQVLSLTVFTWKSRYSSLKTIIILVFWRKYSLCHKTNNYFIKFLFGLECGPLERGAVIIELWLSSSCIQFDLWCANILQYILNALIFCLGGSPFQHYLLSDKVQSTGCSANFSFLNNTKCLTNKVSHQTFLYSLKTVTKENICYISLSIWYPLVDWFLVIEDCEHLIEPPPLHPPVLGQVLGRDHPHLLGLGLILGPRPRRHSPLNSCSLLLRRLWRCW